MKNFPPLNPLLCSILFILFSHQVFAQQASIQTIDLGDGECYATFMEPDEYENEVKRVLVKAATQTVEEIPAEYELVNEEVLVEPERVELIPVPAVYKTVEEKVMLKPEKKRRIKKPATYETVTEQIMVKEAYKKLVIVPAVFEDVVERVLVQEEEKKLINIPAEYENVTEQILVKEASNRLVKIPAEFDVVTEQYEKTPASTRKVILTPKYKTETERVMVRPASTKWVEKNNGANCLSANPADCRIWCLLEVPAEYQTVTKQINIGCDGSGVKNSGCIKEETIPAEYGTRTKRVIKKKDTTRSEAIPAEYSQFVKSVLKNPATTKEEIIPAVYKNITKRVVKTPATTKEELVPAVYDTYQKRVVKEPEHFVEEIIPAEYKTITKRVLVSEATVKENIIPAKYDKITKRVLKANADTKVTELPEEYKEVVERKLKKKGDLVWRRILCDKHLVSDVVRQIQESLKANGYHPGPIDNILGPKTKAAIRQFQLENGFLTGPIDLETAVALGVSVPNYEKPLGSNEAYAENKKSGNNEPIVLATVLSKAGVPPANTGGTSTGNSNSTTDKLAAAEKAAKEKAADRATKAKEEADKKAKEAADKAAEEAKSAAKEKEAAAESKAKEEADKNDDDNDGGSSSMSSGETEMLREVNLMRANPAAYVKHVEEYLKKIDEDTFWDASYKAQEKAAGMELIAELKALGPLSQLKAHDGLYKASQGHGKDLQKIGRVQHVGSDGRHPHERVQQDAKLANGTENIVGGGKDVRESVIMLLVDSGIPNRGHRKALLDPRWTHGSCHSVGFIGQQNDCWIQMFGIK